MLVKEIVGSIVVYTNQSRTFSIAQDSDGSLMAGLGLSFGNETGGETNRSKADKSEILGLFDAFCIKVRREIESSEGGSSADLSAQPSRR